MRYVSFKAEKQNLVGVFYSFSNGFAPGSGGVCTICWMDGMAVIG